jgi:hypothetical protein
VTTVFNTLCFSAILPVSYTAITFVKEFPAQFLFVEVDILFCFFGDEVKTEAGSGGQVNVAVFDNPGFLDQAFA